VRLLASFSVLARGHGLTHPPRIYAREYRRHSGKRLGKSIGALLPLTLTNLAKDDDLLREDCFQVHLPDRRMKRERETERQRPARNLYDPWA
jgi:hypothetical protein